jgi:hypothetical protein
VESGTTPATGKHTNGEKVYSQKANCFAEGIWSIKCTVCGIETASGTSPVVHEPGRKTETVAPTDTEEGEWELRCTMCDAKLDSGTIPPIDGYIYVAPKPDQPFSGKGEKTIRLDVEFYKFTHLTIDGKIISTDYYDAFEGSTIIVFKEAFLRTLPNGAIPVTAHFIDGRASITLLIDMPAEESEKNDSKSTKDETSKDDSGYAKPTAADIIDYEIDEATEDGLEPLGIERDVSGLEEGAAEGSTATANDAVLAIWIIVALAVVGGGRIIWINRKGLQGKISK